MDIFWNNTMTYKKLSTRTKYERQEVMMSVTNVAHSPQEIRQLLIRPPEHRTTKKPLLAGQGICCFKHTQTFEHFSRLETESSS